MEEERKMHRGLCRKSTFGESCLKAKPDSLGWISPAVFGTQVPVEFAAEGLQKNPKLA